MTRVRASLLPLAVLTVPVLVGVSYSAAASVGLLGAGASGFTTQHVLQALAAEQTWRSVAWTVWTAGIATTLSTLVAILLVGPVSRTRVVRLIALAPLALPHVAAALAVLLLLGQSGLLARVGTAVGILSSPSDMPALVYDAPGIGLILSFVWKEVPFLLLAALGVHETLGAQYAETAHSLGASRVTVWRRITVPLLLRGVAPSAIAVLAFLLGQYEMAVLLAPSDPLPLAMLISERATDMDLAARAEAHVLALVAMGLAALLVLWHERVHVREAA